MGLMKFSCLMSVYAKDTPREFELALESIWAFQVVRPDEIVLVCDGPVGESLNDVILNYATKLGPALKIERLPKNRGLAYALNHGLKSCTNELIARMDSDDLAEPERFQNQLRWFEQHPQGSCVGTQIVEIDDFESEIASKKFPILHEEIVRLARYRCPIAHPSVMYRKSSVLSVGGYPLMYPEDYMLWVKMLDEGMQFGNLDTADTRVRVDKNFFERRGLKFFLGEIKIHLWMFQHRKINIFQFTFVILVRLVVRTSPRFLKKTFYGFLRSKI